MTIPVEHQTTVRSGQMYGWNIFDQRTFSDRSFLEFW